MNIRINRVHYPVTVLGPGRRLGLWLQGCSLACKGCVSRDTWSHFHGELVEVDYLVEQCRSLVGDELDGITITGGEPFEQADGLAAFLDAIEPWRQTLGFDVLCYSGKTLKQLQQQYPAILSLLDLLIPEPFVERRPTTAFWRGSANQPLLALSDLGRSKLDRYLLSSPRMQFQVDGESIWFIGIPQRGDMHRLSDLLKQRGIVMEDISWI